MRVGVGATPSPLRSFETKKKEKHMNRRWLVLSAFIACCLLAVSPLLARAARNHRILKVKVNYTGVETVDDKHRIYVLLFDTNPYNATNLVDSTTSATLPAPEAGVCHILRRLSAVAKNDSITFTDLNTSTVYAAAFLDLKGTYDGHSDPAPGGPMGAYGKSLDKVEPIKLEEGKAVEIVITFDDSMKTP